MLSCAALERHIVKCTNMTHCRDNLTQSILVYILLRNVRSHGHTHHLGTFHKRFYNRYQRNQDDILKI